MKKNIFYLSLIWIGMVCFSCASEKDYLVTIQTRHGDMYAVLFDETPRHKNNFIDMAKAGRFDSTDFHRVIQNFMIQGGDVHGKEGLPQEAWPTIPAEIKPGFFHKKGMIAAARQGNNINPERRSSGSQFYIVQGKVYNRDELITDMKLLGETFFKYIQLSSNLELKEEYNRLYKEEQFEALNQMMLDQKANLEKFYSINLEKPMSQEQIEAYTTVGGTPHLDGEYTVFGELIKGLDVLEKIAAEPTGARDIPVNKVYMEVSVELLPKARIEKDFGYTFEK
jgi:peptidyl-prolyl cis-trans isomerase B (cyclophilin B)